MIVYVDLHTGHEESAGWAVIHFQVAMMITSRAGLVLGHQLRCSRRLGVSAPALQLLAEFPEPFAQPLTAHTRPLKGQTPEVFAADAVSC